MAITRVPATMQGAGGWRELSRTAVPTGSGNADIALPSGFEWLRARVINVRVASDNIGFYARFSDDGGATYEADASDYRWDQMNTGNSSVEAANDTEIQLSSAATGLSNTLGGGGYNGTFYIVGADNASISTYIYGNYQYVISGLASNITGVVAGRIVAATVNSHIRFLLTAGNYVSGTIVISGLT